MLKFSRICKHFQNVFSYMEVYFPSKYFKAKIFTDNPKNHEISENFPAPSKYLGSCIYGTLHIEYNVGVSVGEALYTLRYI